MRKRKVVFRPKAEKDLLALYDYVAQEGGRSVAASFIDGIEAACLGLEGRRGDREGNGVP